MLVAQLTRRVRFAAAHRYFRPEWSEERNRATFGACSNPHGHGHNYRLDVTIEGTVDPVTGLAIDLGVLDQLLRDEVVGPLDHQHLNFAVDEFRHGIVPTSENIVAWAWPRIVRRLPPGTRLARLRLHEDEDLYVDYFGGGTP